MVSECCKSSEPLIWGATAKASMRIVRLDPTLKVASLARSAGACVIAVAIDPYGMLTML